MTSFPPEDSIDFDPAQLAAIEQRNGETAFVFPSQPSWSRAVGENPRMVPIYHCEIRIADCDVSIRDCHLPQELNELWLEFAGGARGMFLPFDFWADGPVTLSMEWMELP